MVSQTAGVGRGVCWSVKTAAVGMLVGQTAGVDREVCWSVKWLG